MARISKIQKEINDRAEEVEVKPIEIDYDSVIDSLARRIEALEIKLNAKRVSTINKLETFSDETEPELPTERSMQMTYADKLVSMTNAVKILPPNMIVDGRHSKENIGAICGFIVTDEMWDDVYSNFKHDED